MLDALHSVGNASSVHHHGRDAAARVDKARRQVGELLGCAPGEIIFTSGATEANNLALRAASAQGGALVTTAVEHPAVLETARSLSAESSAPLVTLPVSADGIVDLAALEASVQGEEVAVVSVMLANNETGALADLASVVRIARAAGALVHSDATQYVGRLPVDLDDLDVDLLSLSAHKFGGPQGVGALFVRRGISLPHRPLLVGGGHEKGWRAGTLNVAGIVGMGAAAEAARRQLGDEAPHITKLRDLLEGELLAQLPGSHVNGARAPRLPGVTSITFPGAPADAVLASMPAIAASDGSACSAGAPSPSHVLLAMGLSREAADSTIRFSMGYATTEQEIRRAIDATLRAVTHVQTVMSGTAGP
ncbi:cysteine desulfurase family protein [Streptomyces noursei]|uniref:cysteine desulfurase family protein n=1 Tax=Streptomyces noursei TaxID=1971 RepID=UPI001F04E029